MDKCHFNLGERLFAEQLFYKKPAGAVLEDLFRDVQAGRGDLYSGAMSMALGLIAKARALGVTFKIKNPKYRAVFAARSAQLDANITRAVLNRDWTGASVINEAVGHAVDSLVRAGAIHWKTQEKPSEAKTVEPIPVRIVGSPRRTTVTAIAYDNEGNIVESLSTEQDA